MAVELNLLADGFKNGGQAVYCRNYATGYDHLSFKYTTN